ncbi:MAG: ComEA family DNA-binding protein [Candidatus Omnitrophota bacterium]
MVQLTPAEKRALIFLCLLLSAGGLLRFSGIKAKRLSVYQEEETLPLNINKASLEELKKLPLVGEKTAERIVSYRREKGLFTSLEDLKKVNGIGDKKLSVIKEHITF